MQDGIVLITCERPGCGNDLGAQRYVKGKVVEEEFYPYAKLLEGKYYCEECVNKRDTFRDPAEDIIDDSSN